MRIASGIIGRDLTINNITDFIVDRKLLLSSPGGSLYEGWAIHDLIKGKVDEIGVVGVCASAATIILLAAPIRWGTMNSRFLIHNPYTDVSGDANMMQKTANDLLNEQKILLSKYTEITGINSDRLQSVMSNEIYLTPDEAKTLNLINLIKSEIMDLSQVETKLNVFEKMLNKIKNFIIKNMIVQDVNGKELDFGEDITDASQIVVGVTATVEGNPADGKYVIGDGTQYVFESGKLTEIIMPTEDKANELTAENEALKTENSTLKTEIENLKKSHDEYRAKVETEIKNISTEFINFKKSFSKGSVDANIPPKENEVTVVRKAYKNKK
jgi:ATP-dependent protease ClpP protease subunit